MRIKSSFKDYYDCVQANDAERTTVYVRELKPSGIRGEIFWQFPKAPVGSSRYRMVDSNITVVQQMIGFCGKIYPMLELTLHPKWAGEEYKAPVAVRCWSLEQVTEFMRTRLTEFEFEQYTNKEKKYYRNRPFLQKTERRPAYQEFFEECERKKDAFLGLFEAEHCPIFVATRHNVSENEITFNVMLKKYDFFRIFDVNTAYQEIVMFMNNLAVPMKPIPQLDDVTLAESKGFDKRYSFRQDPIRKRRKK